MDARILSMGEALVDVLPTEDGLWRPVAGGSSFNVALALGRLQAPAAFVGRLSRDEQGRRMRGQLAAAGVDLDLVANDDRPSPLSLIERGTQAESARYSIHLADTAHAPPDLPAGWLADAQHLHTSSFSAITGPWGAAVAAALAAARGLMTRSFDLNIRPALVPPRDETRALVARRIDAVEIVKASEDDLAWLYPDEAPAAVAANWAGAGGRIVLLTRGAAGAVAFLGEAAVSRPAFASRVVDTVGAGDAFMAAFLGRALAAGALGEPLKVAHERLADLLDFSNAAAALCCARAGADAPHLKEVEDFRRTRCRAVELQSQPDQRRSFT